VIAAIVGVVVHRRKQSVKKSMDLKASMEEDQVDIDQFESQVPRYASISSKRSLNLSE
jgi:uncharacterized membrane-anchored protein YhcB (DUF1043 family)